MQSLLTDVRRLHLEHFPAIRVPSYPPAVSLRPTLAVQLPHVSGNVNLQRIKSLGALHRRRGDIIGVGGYSRGTKAPVVKGS